MSVTYVGMLLLYEFEKTGHIGSTEVIYSFQTGEHRGLRQTLEMILANVL